MNLRRNLLIIACFVVTFLVGVAVMRVWDVYHLQKDESQVRVHVPQNVSFTNFKDATTPEGVEVVEDDLATKEDKTSQLVKIDIPNLDYVVSKSGEILKSPDETEKTGHLVPEQTPQRSIGEESSNNMESKISMIDAPVKARLITNSDEYKAFKQIARGSYPVADFKQHNVLALESTSNLPDKVFEIEGVREENGKMVVKYRVNVFGLDQKTNTHSAVLIIKRDLPIELKQIL